MKRITKTITIEVHDHPGFVCNQCAKEEDAEVTALSLMDCYKGPEFIGKQWQAQSWRSRPSGWIELYASGDGGGSSFYVCDECVPKVVPDELKITLERLMRSMTEVK